ncbi:MAG: UDP-N-acetylmuramate--L-alanine ligase [Bdellovibrionales bacterium]|nr:UDP-N-acetylmuramate--L-alanine ligase [Bdellovibrionales bacterium]
MTIANSNVHFIGIGGIGMCGLAELLHKMGAQVTGSDLSKNGQTENLEKLGISVFYGHDKKNIHSQVDVVVYSSAVKSDNIEFQMAKELKIPMIPRAEALAEIMLLKKGIAVAGTHGKTTTTSLVSSIFLEAELAPTIFVGGVVDKIKSTAQLGDGEWLIAEADESDGSFHRLSPYLSVITNIDSDHLDFYGSFEAVQKSFYDFALRVPFYGKVIVYGDDPKNRTLFRDFPKKILFYGFDKENDYRLERGNGHFKVYIENQEVLTFFPTMPGDHNALNCLAALSVSHSAGIDLQVCKSGIEGFSGVARRSQYKGKFNEIEIYDDYGHHPTEIEAVLKAFKEKVHEGRLVALFEPHRYSRTKDCWQGFVKAFENVDELFVIDIYPAGENPISGIESSRLAQEIDQKNVTYIPFSTSQISSAEEVLEKSPEILAQISKCLQPGDCFITMGAGKVYRIGEALVNSQK